MLPFRGLDWAHHSGSMVPVEPPADNPTPAEVAEAGRYQHCACVYTAPDSMAETMLVYGGQRRCVMFPHPQR